MRESTGRALRINEMKKIITEMNAKGTEINKRKLIAELCLYWNVSYRKVNEYMDLLILTEFINDTPTGIILNG